MIPQEDERDPLKLHDSLSEIGLHETLSESLSLHDVLVAVLQDDSKPDDVEHEICPADTEHDCEPDGDTEHDCDPDDSEHDVDACTIAETHDTESETDMRNTLHDRLEPVEHDSEGEILEHEVLPDIDSLDEENEMLLISYNVNMPANSVSQSPPHICIGRFTSAILTSN